MRKWNIAMLAIVTAASISGSRSAHAGGTRGSWAYLGGPGVTGVTAIAGALGELYAVACNPDGCSSVPKSIYRYRADTGTWNLEVSNAAKTHHSVALDTYTGDLYYLGPNGEIRHRYLSGWWWATETLPGCARDIAAYKGTVYVVGCGNPWDASFGAPSLVFRKRPTESSWTAIGYTGFSAKQIAISSSDGPGPTPAEKDDGRLFALGAPIDNLLTQNQLFRYDRATDHFYPMVLGASATVPSGYGCRDIVSNASSVNCVSRYQADGSLGNGHLDIWSWIGDPAGSGYWSSVIHGIGFAAYDVGYAQLTTAIPGWEWNYVLLTGGDGSSGVTFRQTSQPQFL